MVDSGHLALITVTLAPGVNWIGRGEGLLFVFPRNGTGQSACGSLIHPLVTGDVFVVHGSTGTTVSCANTEPFVFGWFLVRLEHLYPLFESSEISVLHNVAESFRGPKRYTADTGFSADCHRLLSEIPREINLDHRGRLLRVASAILSREFEHAQHERAGSIPGEDHFFRVFEKLSTDDIINLAVGDLATRFGCGRRHLNRLFHKHVGVSVAVLRMEIRLMKAVALLRDPESKIISVASQCGFNHLGLFNACFKRKFGASPGQWRKAHLDGNGDGLRPFPGFHILGATDAAAAKSPSTPATIPSPTAVNLLQLKAAELLSQNPDARARKSLGG